jgi:hypothetical protein
LKPIVVAQRSATTTLAQFLEQLLRPVVQRHIESTTFANGTDFIRKVSESTDSVHRLHSKTLFAIISITNADDMATHDGMLFVLERFLLDNLAVPAVENISIRRVIELTSLFLNHNRFYYDRKIYRFKRGSPNSLPLTETLRTIYISQWQKLLLREASIRKEFFGRFDSRFLPRGTQTMFHCRYRNQFFFTWNETSDALNAIVQAQDNRATNVQVELRIGHSVEFLDALIENRNGVLCTRVHHDPKRHAYTLPYVVGNSTAAHSHWLRSSLIRAVRYCSAVKDFNHERIRLEIACLANGYSLAFVEQRIEHFFAYFDAAQLRLILDETIYKRLRHRLLNFISEQRRSFENQCAFEKRNQLIHLSYLYEYGPRHKFNVVLHQVVSDHLHLDAQAPRNQVKFMLTTKKQHSLNALLSEQKPLVALLSNTMR